MRCNTFQWRLLIPTKEGPVMSRVGEVIEKNKGLVVVNQSTPRVVIVGSSK